jgi:hypothetical protein
LIEFKGTYYSRSSKETQSVLVQFDGVLLHVWHMSNPFYRLMTSDVFKLPPALAGGRRQIRLPNGGRIETDDIDALVSLQSSRYTRIEPPGRAFTASPRLLALAGCTALLFAGLLAAWLLDF